MNDLNLELESRVQASRLGDKEAFGWIVSRYQGLVCSVTYSITGSVEQSEDLAQEAFIAAWQRLGDLREIAKLPAWLCAIARNLANSALRRRERDPLRQAEPLKDVHSAPHTDIAENLARAEREALLWRTLEVIPAQYREPLVLYYREEQSVRSIAEALDISENAAKQRLSRGRKMLKAEVERVVEDSLRLTRPGAVLTVAVLAALPALTAQAGAAGALAGSGALGKTTVAVTGKVAAGVALAAGAGALGGLAGGVAGATGGFFGMWMSILNNPTLRTRRYMLKVCAMFHALVWLWLGIGAMGWLLLPDIRAWMVCAWVILGLADLPLILHINRKYRRILEEDVGRRPAAGLPLEQSFLSRRRLWRFFFWMLPPAVAASAACVVWFCSVPPLSAFWPIPAGLALLEHYVFFELFRKGLRIAYDDAAFAAYPPAISGLAEATLGLDSAKGKREAWGFEYKSPIEFFGLPLVHVSFKYRFSGRPVVAKGIIAIGQFAYGIVTISQFGVGVISISEFTIAGFAIAQFTIAGFALAQFAFAYSLIAQFGIFIHAGYGQFVKSLLESIRTF